MTDVKDMTYRELVDGVKGRWGLGKAIGCEFELMERLASSVPTGPRCPKCSETNLQWADFGGEIFCQDCGADFAPKAISDFAQFFVAPVAGAKVEEVATELVARFGQHRADFNVGNVAAILRPYLQVSQPPASVIESAMQLLDAMETCHICKVQVLLDEMPVHCEDCSADCEGHDEPDCVTIQALHANLRRLIKGITYLSPLSDN